MISRTTLLVAAAMSNVREDLQAAVSPNDPLHVMAEALDNLDWSYFDGLSDVELCDHIGHDFNWDNGQLCRNCGEEK
jgi:hypothetical protein